MDFPNNVCAKKYGKIIKVVEELLYGTGIYGTSSIMFHHYRTFEIMYQF